MMVWEIVAIRMETRDAYVAAIAAGAISHEDEDVGDDLHLPADATEKCRELDARYRYFRELRRGWNRPGYRPVMVDFDPPFPYPQLHPEMNAFQPGDRFRDPPWRRRR